MTPAPLRIVYLAQNYLPESGALPARVSEMAQHWLARGAQVTVLAAMPHRPEGRIRPEYRGRLFAESFEHGMRVLRSWVFASPSHSTVSTLANNLSYATLSAAQALFSDIEGDVLIASEPPFFPHITGMALGWAWRKPVVLEIRDLWPDYIAEMGLLPPAALRALFALERSMLVRASHVVTVTESFRRRVIEKGGASDRVTVISNGVDAGFYRPAEEPSHPVVAKAPGERIIGYIGNFGRGQGLEQVIDAAGRLEQARGDTRFVLVGDGPTRAQIGALAASARVQRVTIADPIPKNTTRQFYNSCDVVLVPLAPLRVFEETVPSKLFEILACGRPLVASVAGEAARIVERSGGGFVSPPGDGAALASTIATALNQPAAERATRAHNAREFVVREFSRESLAQRYLDVLERVAAEWSQRR